MAFEAAADALARNYSYGSSAPVSLSEPLMPMSDSSTSSGLSMGDIAGILGMAMTASSDGSATGDMLGSPTQLSVNDNGNSAQLIGTINGKMVNKHVQRNGRNGIVIM